MAQLLQDRPVESWKLPQVIASPFGTKMAFYLGSDGGSSVYVEMQRGYVPTGPADIRFIWEKNRHALETCVPVQTHMLPDGRAHALSWLRDAVRETTEYSCSVLSSAGNQTSKVQITVMRHGKFRATQSATRLGALSLCGLSKDTCVASV